MQFSPSILMGAGLLTASSALFHPNILSLSTLRAQRMQIEKAVPAPKNKPIGMGLSAHSFTKRRCLPGKRPREASFIRKVVNVGIGAFV